MALTAKNRKLLASALRLMNSRITKGIAYLDNRFKRDNWLIEIDEGKLDISDGDTCITGQAFDEHWEGFKDEMYKKMTGKTQDELEDACSQKDDYSKLDKASDKFEKIAAGYGFLINSEDEMDNPFIGYDNLTRLWFNRISIMKMEAGIELASPPPFKD